MTKIITSLLLSISVSLAVQSSSYGNTERTKIRSSHEAYNAIESNKINIKMIARDKQSLAISRIRDLKSTLRELSSEARVMRSSKRDAYTYNRW